MKFTKHSNSVFGTMFKYFSVLFIFFIFNSTVNAAVGNTSGSAWGGTSSTDGAYRGIGSISLSGGTYGVTIPSSNGSLSGYAWNNNYGWLDFSGVNRSGNSLTGTANFLAISSNGGGIGGWNGNVSMSGSNYGVTISGTSLSGYAWTPELGWIDFSGVSFSPPPSNTPTVQIKFGMMDKIKSSIENIFAMFNVSHVFAAD